MFVSGNPEVYSFSRRPLWGMSLIALLRIIKASDKFDMQDITIWYLLLDTSSPVSDLASYGSNASSSRLTKALSLLPPRIYLGFNLMVDVGHSKVRKPGDVLKVGHQKAYGRLVSSDTCTSPLLFLLYFTLQYWSGLSTFEVLHAAREKFFF